MLLAATEAAPDLTLDHIEEPKPNPLRSLMVQRIIGMTGMQFTRQEQDKSSYSSRLH